MEEGKGGIQSGASGLASTLGIDLGGAGGGGAFEANNLAELMKSRLIVEKVLLSEFNDGSGGGKKKTFADAYMTMYPSFIKTTLLGKKSPIETFYGYDNNLGTDRLKDSVLGKIFEKMVKNHLFIEKSNNFTKSYLFIISII